MKYVLFGGEDYSEGGGANDYIASSDSLNDLISLARSLKDKKCVKDDSYFEWWNILDTDSGEIADTSNGKPTFDYRIKWDLSKSGFSNSNTAGQTGFQDQDFAVQVEAGQSIMMEFTNNKVPTMIKSFFLSVVAVAGFCALVYLAINSGGF